MGRTARLMLESWPFHITHRGNHRKRVFRHDADRRTYLALLDRYARKHGMSIWAYCLMTNHVHLIAAGQRRDSISKALGNAHRALSHIRNRETSVTGHLWANRFFSTLLDETHLWSAVRYVELNPVRGHLVVDAIDYPWSSARDHCGFRVSSLLDPERPFPGPIGNWATWLRSGLDDQFAERLRRNTSTGCPTASDRLIRDLETRLGRRLRVQRTRRSSNRLN